MSYTEATNFFLRPGDTSFVAIPEEQMTSIPVIPENAELLGMSFPPQEQGAPLAVQPTVQPTGQPIPVTPQIVAEPVVEQVSYPSVSAFQMPNTDLLEATQGPNSFTGQFLGRMRALQQAREDRALNQKRVENDMRYKDITAQAQLLNAMRGRANPVEAEYQALAQIYGPTRAQELLANKYAANRGTTINIGDKNMQERTRRMDDLIAKDIEELRKADMDAQQYDMYGRTAMEAIQGGQLSATGRVGSEFLYTAGRMLGLTDKATNEAVQALQSYGSLYRASIARPIAGGQITNTEQQIIGLAVPGLDKTPEQNLLAIRAGLGLRGIQAAVLDLTQQLFMDGVDGVEIGRQAKALREKMSTALLKELAPNVNPAKADQPTQPKVGDVRDYNGHTYVWGENGLWNLQR